ncbi:SMP-30/gluconolactonase/LRE family protein [Aureisphaera galaxeae]|nr:SMP-30/gluconolactonase/LRE family protein [Aureisphaera galaxeae]
MLYDSDLDVFYISNGEAYQPGTSGFLSKVSSAGELLSLRWIDSLSRPTGMALRDGKLYVADVNALRVIDTQTGELIKTFKEPIPNSGLNDVTISSKGEVFVTASFVHSVFKLENDTLVPWLQDEDLLKWANGITSHRNKIMVGGLHLCAIDIESKAINKITLVPEFSDFDGLIPDRQGGYIATTVEGGQLLHIDILGNTIELKTDKEVYLGDLTFIRDQLRIFIPRGNHATNDYFISVIELTK